MVYSVSSLVWSFDHARARSSRGCLVSRPGGRRGEPFRVAELEPNRFVRWQPVAGISLGMAGVLALGLGYATRLHPYLAWLAGATLVGFGLFGADKLLARFNRRRLPERALLLMILLGGFVGGWLGLFVFRHKLRSWLFWLVLSVASGLHGTALWFIWQHTGFR
jgi:uncharacterized membrane protein YsdA (DUF1294 family)